MENTSAIQLFEDQPIRAAWDEEKEEWYFSIVDVVRVLTEQPDTRHAAKYWSVLKTRIKAESGQLTTICSQLKLKSADGKRYLTDVADTEQLLRIIQSIPSPKAEPFKLWLAQVGRERIEETIDPELAIDRALETYLKKGYTREWINQRLQAIQVRKELTEGLKKENLRDNMTTTELVLNMLAETSTTDISKAEQPQSFSENMDVARKGGEVAGIARKALEERTGKPVITAKNATQLNAIVTALIEDAAEKGK